nr:structure-specific endonuclease subunit SLX1 [Tanacetum cinerariifolium]
MNFHIIHKDTKKLKMFNFYNGSWDDEDPEKSGQFRDVEIFEQLSYLDDMDKNEPRTAIASSSHQVEVIDIFSPLLEYRIRSRRTEKGVSSVWLEIIDLTESPICV